MMLVETRKTGAGLLSSARALMTTASRVQTASITVAIVKIKASCPMETSGAARQRSSQKAMMRMRISA